MGQESSTPGDTSGAVNGRPVKWFYKRAQDGEDGRLSWAEGSVVCESFKVSERNDISS